LQPLFRNPVQSHAAIQCNGMLPPSAITKGVRKVSSAPEAESRLRFGQTDVGFEFRGE